VPNSFETHVYRNSGKTRGAAFNYCRAPRNRSPDHRSGASTDCSGKTNAGWGFNAAGRPVLIGPDRGCGGADFLRSDPARTRWALSRKSQGTIDCRRFGFGNFRISTGSGSFSSRTERFDPPPPPSRCGDRDISGSPSLSATPSLACGVLTDILRRHGKARGTKTGRRNDAPCPIWWTAPALRGAASDFRPRPPDRLWHTGAEIHANRAGAAMGGGGGGGSRGAEGRRACARPGHMPRGTVRPGGAGAGCRRIRACRFLQRDRGLNRAGWSGPLSRDLSTGLKQRGFPGLLRIRIPTQATDGRGAWPARNFGEGGGATGGWLTPSGPAALRRFFARPGVFFRKTCVGIPGRGTPQWGGDENTTGRCTPQRANSPGIFLFKISIDRKKLEGPAL